MLLTYPTNAEIMEIEQDKLPAFVEDNPIFDFFPVETADTSKVIWEQQDNYGGLQQIRGKDGKPPSVQKPGYKRFEAEPGYYMEFEPIMESEVTDRRVPGTFGTPTDVTDLVMLAQDNLLVRRLNRQAWLLWQLVVLGEFNVFSNEGTLLHTDIYDLQEVIATVPWTTVATAVPIQNFREQQLLNRGTSSRYGRESVSFMNRVTANLMLNNTNPLDIGGKRIEGGGNFLKLEHVNSLLVAEDLPEIRIYDDGWHADDGVTFTPWIPDYYVVTFGTRPNKARIGAFKQTRNAHNPGLAPGPFTKVVEVTETDPGGIIMRIYDGHNGGPVLYFPSAISVMYVGP